MRVGFLGPPGTFTEQALRTQPDLAVAEEVAYPTIPDVLVATADGEVDLGFVPIENAIEGAVNVTLDALAFDHALLVQREVVIDVSLHLLGPPGLGLGDVRRVVSFGPAMAQVRGWLHSTLPGAVVDTDVGSTAEAARHVGAERPPGSAAVANALAAELYGLEVIAAEIEDHPENQTRFLVVAPSGVPAPTGHDKTTVVCFQYADRPGSLVGILQEFAARAINLNLLVSRPTKKGLGDYCFLVDLEGHVADELVADCLRDLKVKLADVKFLGSYPAAGRRGGPPRAEAEAAWRAADDWVAALRQEVGRGLAG